MKTINRKRKMATSRLAILTGLFAVTSTSVQAADFMPLSVDCESALALSAAPETVQAGAGIYVLAEDGFEMVRESTNGYTCFVERSSYEGIAPQCFHETARAANVQVMFDEGKMLREGASFEDVIQYRAEVLETDKYPEPEPGVAYMVSEFNYVSKNNRILWVAPHIMFHAPYVERSDYVVSLGDAAENTGLPILNQAGRHGLIVTFIEHGSSATPVNEACAGQLPDYGTVFNFPSDIVKQ